jgi:lysophospholipase L1-like esterase
MVATGGWLRRVLAVGVSVFALTLTSMVGTASASTPAPPFNQCPAIGAAPSCDILLVVNPDQSISVLGDPSVGPYDGGDDTLVGIVNNSSASIAAITVSGPGSGLAGFDGDGICTYATGGTVGSGFTGDSYCTSQQLAGTDPSDYAGPGTSFTLDASSLDDVEVDFAGNGLAPHGSTYFSLEGALTAAVVTARKGGLAKYVALGDSYSSGEGNPPFTETTSGCDRSVSQAWPELVSKMFGLNLDMLACSGATTAALSNTYKGQPKQLNDLTKVSTPKLVTITMGGNDLHFPTLVAGCFIADPADCAAVFTGFEGQLAAGFGKHMTAVYKEVKADAKGAPVVVVGYPQIIPGNPLTAIRHCPTIVQPALVPLMHEVGIQLDSVLARAAAAAGVNYVSTLNVLKGHELCTADPWVNSVYSGPTSGRAHPNAQGQAIMAAAVEDYVVLHHLLPGM